MWWFDKPKKSAFLKRLERTGVRPELLDVLELPPPPQTIEKWVAEKKQVMHVWEVREEGKPRWVYGVYLGRYLAAVDEDKLVMEFAWPGYEARMNRMR